MWGKGDSLSPSLPANSLSPVHTHTHTHTHSLPHTVSSHQQRLSAASSAVAAAPHSSSASSASDIPTAGVFCVSTGAIVVPPCLDKEQHHGHDGEQRATRREFQRLAEEELASDCHGYISAARYVEAPFMSVHVC